LTQGSRAALFTAYYSELAICGTSHAFHSDDKPKDFRIPAHSTIDPSDLPAPGDVSRLRQTTTSSVPLAAIIEWNATDS
jgi:hypothetical protein